MYTNSNLTKLCIQKICGEVIELVTIDAPNDTDVEESGEGERHKTELETVVYENNFHDIGK